MSRFRLLTAAIWIGYLLVVTCGPDWRSLITPGVRVMAMASAGVLALLCLLASRGGVARTGGGWGVPLAVLPLFLLWRSGIGALDHTAAAGRTAIAPTAPVEAAATAPVPDDGRVPLDRLAADPQRQVTVLAMLVKPVGRLNYLLPITGPRPPDPVALLRFRIVCCAADAAPVAVAVLGISQAEVEDGTWVEATGTVQAMDGGVVLAATSWHPIPTPDDPYLRGGSTLPP